MMIRLGRKPFSMTPAAAAPMLFWRSIGATRGLGHPVAPRRLMTKAQSLTGFYLPGCFEKPN
jgi:hypothetical protein